MRMKLFFIFFLFQITFGVYANENDFSKAEKFYSQEKYEEALKIYQSILGENEISSTIFYNIGNCYFKMGDYVNALFYYEKSYKYNPSQEDVLMNMEITRSRLTDKSEEMSSGVSGWFYQVVNSRAADYWTYLSIGLSILGTIFLFLMYFSNQNSLKRMSLATALASFVFMIVFSIFAYYQTAYFNNENHALVSESNAEVRSEPSEKSKAVFIVPGGMKVKILSEKEDWTEISLNNNVGWIKTEWVKKI